MVKKNLKEKLKKHDKFFKFGIIGGIGTVVNTVLLYILTFYAGLFYIIASVIATEIAIVSNFIGNHVFTFKDNKDPSPLRTKFARFQFISLSTIVGTVFLLWLFTTLFGIQHLLIWNFLAILTMFMANFVLNKKFTWKENNSSKKNKKSGMIGIILVFSLIFIGSVSAVELVSVSQNGYHPNAHKQVLVYFDNESSFVRLINALTNKVEGTYELKRPVNAYSGEEVNCQGDLPCQIAYFSDFEKEGEYYFRTENGARSSNFKINSNVYENDVDKFMNFFEALKQQDSGYHKDLHSDYDVPFTIMADGSFIMESHQASNTLIRLGSAYNRNPELFEGTDVKEHIKLYVDYLKSLQGLEIEENTNGEGFRLNPHVEPINAFVPGETNLTEIDVYSPGNPPSFVKTVEVESLCGDKNGTEYDNCIDYAAEYYRCQEDEVCLNMEYLENTGTVSSSGNGYGVAKGWSYEFGCFVDIDVNEPAFNGDYNPCMIFNDKESSLNTIQALLGFLEAIPAVYDDSPREAEELFDHAKGTYEFVEDEYSNYKSSSESAAYWGAASFLMYDYTGEDKYLEEAYSVREDVSVHLISDNFESEEFYWEEYIKHKEEIIDSDRDYEINGNDPDAIFRNKIFGDYKDKGFLSMANKGEKVFEFSPEVKFQNSKYILLEGIYATKAMDTYEEYEFFIPEVANNQIYFLTGMNAIQQGASTETEIDSQSFIIGIGDGPSEFHSRYLFNTGYKESSDGEIIGARGTDLQYNNGSEYVYLDGVATIMGKKFGSIGNELNGEKKSPTYHPGSGFANGEKVIEGWIDGPYDIPEDKDTIYNFDDDMNTFEFTESTNEIVSTGVEYVAYLDAIQNSRLSYDELNGEIRFSENNLSSSVLFVNSAPKGASIYLNGINKNQLTPYEFNLSYGEYNVSVELEGYYGNSTIVTLNESGDESVLIYLSENNSTVPGNSNSSGSGSGTGGAEIIYEDISLDENSEGGYGVLERDTVSFEVRLNESDSVMWEINGEFYEITNESRIHEIAWNPGILYTGNSETAAVRASTGGDSVEWNITIDNVLNPFFDPEDGTSGTTIHVYTNDFRETYDEINVSVQGTEGSNQVKKSYSLVPNPVENNETNWQYFIPNSELNNGDNYLVTVSVITTSGDTNVYTLPANQESVYRAFHKSPPSSSSGGGGGGGSGGGGGGSGSSLPITPELVYVTLDKSLVGINDTQNIKLDARSSIAINSVVATFHNPQKNYETHNLELISGSNTYGTWSYNMSELEVGLYELTLVTISTSGGDEEIEVANRSFYVLDGEVGDSENLMLVYTSLSHSEVTNTTDVTLTLDARDAVGVENVEAEISVRKGEQNPYVMTIPLEMISGEPKYGTWEGSWEINRSDTTYTVTKITLSNGEDRKEYQISDRSVYATSDVPESMPELGGNILTGFSIFGNNLDDIRNLRGPYTPFVVGFVVLIVVTGSALTVRKIKSKNK